MSLKIIIVIIFMLNNRISYLYKIFLFDIMFLNWRWLVMANSDDKFTKKRNIPVKGKMIIPSLTYDAMFKAVLDNNSILLDKLVNAIIKHCKLAITEDRELELLKNELALHKNSSKKLICDYLIRVNGSMDINLELNRYYYEEQPNRNLDYAFTIYSRHFKSSSNYLEYGKYNIIQINFNNYPNPFRDKYFPYMLG